MNKIKVGLTVVPSQDFWQASKELFEQNLVDIIEWNYDYYFELQKCPNIISNILEQYSKKKSLLGHGARLSAFSAKFSERQKAWLKLFENEIKKYNYNHISEHFGFMETDKFYESALLPVPLTHTSLRLGQEMLKRLEEISKLKIGIENLALGFSEYDALNQGEFLDKLLEPIDGFLLLDLHNIYCQIHNFNIDPKTLLKTYPLSRVEEIHISGGSWSYFSQESNKLKIRRDTHDHEVPAEVFELLKYVLELCPKLKYIILEQQENTLHSLSDHMQFRTDFLHIRQLVNKRLNYA